ncbi:hypothetical protein L204_102312 [Cryptococcus depauperatus]
MSFKRRIPLANSLPPGAVSSATHVLPLLPTGLPSLDDLLGGSGLPFHAILLVLAPDTQSAWGRLVERYFMAQGLMTDQKVVLVGQQEEVESVVKGCMWVEGGTAEAGDGSESEGEGGVEGGASKIAWRYEKMAMFKTTVSGNSSNLSLMTTIPSAVVEAKLQSGQLSYISVNPDGPSSSEGDLLDQVLKNIWEKLEKAGQSKVTRVVIHELASLDWGSLSIISINRFIHSLRALLQSRPASAIITIPASLLHALGNDRERVVRNWAWGVDSCVELKGFADDPTLPLIFPTHGLLTLHSYPTSSALLPPTLKHSTLLGISQSSTASSSGGGGAGENNLGFRLKRKKFVVETVHLGIEGGVGERRVEGDVNKALHGVGSTDSHTFTETASTGVEPVLKTTSIGKSKEDLPHGADLDNKKPSKPRVRVRFGGEDDMISVTKAGGDEAESHSQHPHKHDHVHEHGAESRRKGPQRVAMRHDRPDLYDF